MPMQKPSRFLHKQDGQGVVEYILLIVVIIMMATAIGARLFKPVNEWMRHYIGDYIYCLLDEGELPSLGGEEMVTECDKKFESFSFENGRAPREEKSEQANSGNSRSRGRGGSSYVIQGGRSRSNVGVGMDGGGGKPPGISIPIDEATRSKRTSSTYYSGSSGGRSQPVESTYRGFTGIIEREREKIKKREEKVQGVARADNSGTGASAGNKKMMAVDPPAKKINDTEIEVGDWSIGAWVRTILIIMIIIALALFLAGQLAQISKSMEKN